MINDSSPQEIARSMHLRYVEVTAKGFKRIKKRKSFTYLDATNKEIKDNDVLARIHNLVLPPAWTDVWICPYNNGHLQATGIDVRGRKQYRYHNSWIKTRNETKFDNIHSFGKKLPLLRKQIKKDIVRKEMGKIKVCAIALGIMDETFIRAGNISYEKEYGSYGLTTLKNRHVTFHGSTAFFKFTGKKGVPQMIALKNAALVKLLKRVKELPGQELFQYYNEENELIKLDSGDVNEYIRMHIGEAFSCKDFRTWAGGVIAFLFMSKDDEDNSTTINRKKLTEIVDNVAAKLGNTRTVCRKYYIHPSLLTSYEAGKLDDALLKLKQHAYKGRPYQQAEKALIHFLKPKTRNK